MLFLLVLAIAAASRSVEWDRVSSASMASSVPFTLALKQRNLDVLKEKVLARSDPTSSFYAQWMSKEEIETLVSPLAAERDSLTAALAKEGITVVSDRGDSFLCSAPASVIERVFSTQLSVMKHRESGRFVFHCGDFAVPSSLSHIVEFIADLPMLPRKSAVGPKLHTRKSTSASSAENFGSIIPGFLRLIYGMPSTTFSPNASLALVEFMDYSSYSKSNLATFLKETNNPQWTMSHIVGQFSGVGLESVLDVQFGGTLARGTSIWFWTGSRWLLDWAQTFFAAQQIPSVASMSWGWPSDSMCGGQNPGNCSTGITSQQYTTRTDAEFMKIAGRGVTLVGASGDQGAPGDDYYTCSPGLSDIMPASSLWVTAVGATQLGKASSSQQQRRSLVRSSKANASPFGASICKSFFHPLGHKCADGSNLYEVTCSYANGALITSGGGFQSYFPRPAWQNTAVTTYLNNAKSTLPPSQYFNASNRAFPDVSALGHNYLIYSGTAEDVDGTSASTPVFGAMVALWNAQRLAAGKTTLGHVAPLMYHIASAVPGAFNDIVVGDNKCTESCCSMGFTAIAGWDAATGLGTPKWSKIAAYIATLN